MFDGRTGLTWGRMWVGTECATAARLGAAKSGRCMADVADSLGPSQGAPRETRLSPERLPCSCRDALGGCGAAARSRPGSPACRPCTCICHTTSMSVHFQCKSIHAWNGRATARLLELMAFMNKTVLDSAFHSDISRE